MVVEFANKLQVEDNLSKYDAIVKSSSQRFRPILMTVLAMIIGVLPLVVASGAGSVSRQCIGIVIASGLMVGAVFSLFILPVMYMYISSDKQKAVRMKIENKQKIQRVNNREV
jgi:multidrug efflux pump